MRRVCDADGREKHGSRLLLPGSIDAVVLPQWSIVISVSLRNRGAKGGIHNSTEVSIEMS